MRCLATVIPNEKCIFNTFSPTAFACSPGYVEANLIYLDIFSGPFLIRRQQTFNKWRPFRLISSLRIPALVGMSDTKKPLWPFQHGLEGHSQDEIVWKSDRPPLPLSRFIFPSTPLESISYIKAASLYQRPALCWLLAFALRDFFAKDNESREDCKV